MLLSGVAQSVDSDRAANVQAPAQAPRRGGRGGPRQAKVFLPGPKRREKTARAPTGGPSPALWPSGWDNSQDLAGWWLSEKLDGVRAYWDGKALISRLGNRFHAPDWFLAGLPDFPLDGELWIGRKSFQRTVSIVRRQDKSDLWKEVRYVAFDAPAVDAAFEGRLAAIHSHIERFRPPYLSAHEHAICTDLDHLRAELARIEALGGEGLMLRQPESRYEVGRSLTLLKVKTFHDAEARVLEREGGRPAQGTPRRTPGGAAQWHAVLGGNRLLRRRTRRTAAGRLGHHVPLSGAVRRRRSAVPVVRRRAERRPIAGRAASHRYC